jgi:hypothetical protein
VIFQKVKELSYDKKRSIKPKEASRNRQAPKTAADYQQEHPNLY